MNLEFLKGWKTILFNILAGLVVIARMNGYDDFSLDPQWETAIIVMFNFVLRLITTSPVFQKSQ